MSEPNDESLLDPLFTTAPMRAAWSGKARLQGILDFEAALARAQAEVGVIPADAASAIAAQCQADLFDARAIAQDTRSAGVLAIPVVKRLTAAVAAASGGPDGPARFVHWGATSQDAVDTGLVLQMRRGLDLIDARLASLAGTLRALSDRHRDTVLAGRTWLQHALPTTLGLKTAGHLHAVERHRARLAEVRPRALVVQLGGAAGTRVALGEKAAAITAALAQELHLHDRALPWHAHRDSVAEVATTLGLLVGTLGKNARDVALLMQTDVGEAFEPAGVDRGGSSTMPHKRNPVGAAVALAASLRVPGLVATMLTAMVQEHERGLGGWHAEWETLPEIFTLTAGALDHICEVCEGLDVQPEVMAANLGRTHGLHFAEAVSLALAAKMGRIEAHRLVELACRRAIDEKRPLRDVLENDEIVAAQLSAADLDRLFDLQPHIDAACALVARALET